MTIEIDGDECEIIKTLFAMSQLGLNSLRSMTASTHHPIYKAFKTDKQEKVKNLANKVGYTIEEFLKEENHG
jgi:hypothetical protein